MGNNRLIPIKFRKMRDDNVNMMGHFLKNMKIPAYVNLLKISLNQLYVRNIS